MENSFSEQDFFYDLNTHQDFEASTFNSTSNNPNENKYEPEKLDSSPFDEETIFPRKQVQQRQKKRPIVVDLAPEKKKRPHQINLIDSENESLAEQPQKDQRYLPFSSVLPSFSTSSSSSSSLSSSSSSSPPSFLPLPSPSSHVSPPSLFSTSLLPSSSQSSSLSSPFHSPSSSSVPPSSNTPNSSFARTGQVSNSPSLSFSNSSRERDRRARNRSLHFPSTHPHLNHRHFSDDFETDESDDALEALDYYSERIIPNRPSNFPVLGSMSFSHVPSIPSPNLNSSSNPYNASQNANPHGVSLPQIRQVPSRRPTHPYHSRYTGVSFLSQSSAGQGFSNTRGLQRFLPQFYLLAYERTSQGPNNPVDPSLLPMLFMDRDFDENDYEMLLRLDESIEKRNGATIDEINKLSSYILEECDGSKCCICLGEMETGEKVKKLPCSHFFHEECIVPWLQTNKVCPVDKNSISKKPDA